MEKRSVNRLLLAMGLVNLFFAVVPLAMGRFIWGLLFLYGGAVYMLLALYSPRLNRLLQERLPWIPALPPWLLTGLGMSPSLLLLIVAYFSDRW